MFYRSVAYIDMASEPNGNRKVERFKLSYPLKAQIAAFDQGKPVEPGEYQLLAPPKSDTLEVQRKRQAEWRARNNKLYGKTAAPKNGKKRVYKQDLTVRNGTGAVKFLAGK
jgi:hypothetical protein